MLQVTCQSQSNKTACTEDQTLQDTKHHMYQLVYIASMVSVLAFGIIKGLAFTNTTLMASSSLHNRVFNKVVCHSGLLAHPITQSTALSRTCVGLWVTEQLSWSLPSCFQGICHWLEYHIRRAISKSNRDTPLTLRPEGW